MNFLNLKNAIINIVPEYETLSYAQIANILNQEINLRTYILKISDLELFIDKYRLRDAIIYVIDNYSSDDINKAINVKSTFKWLNELGNKSYKELDLNFEDVNNNKPIKESMLLIMNILAEMNFIDITKVDAHIELLEALTDIKTKRIYNYNIYETISEEYIKEALLL